MKQIFTKVSKLLRPKINRKPKHARQTQSGKHAKVTGFVNIVQPQKTAHGRLYGTGKHAKFSIYKTPQMRLNDIADNAAIHKK